jgi:acyl carrier protein
LKDRVLRIVSEVMNVPMEGLGDDTSPDTVENWDSLKHMNLILALEEEFQLTFTDEEIVQMLSVEIIIETLREKGL